MAAYIMRSDIAPRSWKKVACAYYVHGQEMPRPMDEDEFRVLLMCDGEQDMDAYLADHPEDRAILEHLAAHGMVHEAQPDEGLSEWQRYRNCQNPVVPYITLELTQRCNYSCLHCFNAADLHASSLELTYEQICGILDQARECGMQNVIVTGGEPMLHPRFMDIMHAVYDRGMTVCGINTNAYFLTPEILQEMTDSGMRPKMKISFDGLGFHDFMRQSKGCEERTLKAIAMCVEYGFPTKVHVNMNRKNLDTILPTLLKLDSLGVNETRITRTTESPRWNMVAPDSSLGWSDVYEAGLKIARDYCAADTKMRVEFWLFLSVNPKNKTFWCWDVHYNEEKFRCSRPLCKKNRGNLSVGASGNVYPCLETSGGFDALGVVCGNVLQTPIQQLLNDSLYARLAQACVQDRIDKNDRCGGCPFLKYCGGGCTAMAAISSANYFGPDSSACIFYRDGWHAKVAAAFEGWKDLAPMPDDIDATYLKELDISDSTALDLARLKASGLASF